ncbi:DsbA family protein [Streptomyces sp. A73]|uniref:DsbA family oxidoreductase n=1 Tax=Streptomyces sp. RK75 TaxID=2824895 RepID=UPI000C1981AE|nr:DsbA family protein [Streptomyces sp. RK75]MBQ0868810.1 DsbA family protein [Streptomyces sp. RK75]MBQ1159451.1 DsbA family protein [Streptomyces sp. A73]
MTAQIHLWSDYVCPFCLIADEMIERAITDRPEVEVVHHAHELRSRPTPTLRSEDPYLPEIWERAVYPMARHHQIPMRLPTISPQPYTELAFRGAQYAADQGRAQAYHRRVMTAFFREDLDIGDRAVLFRLAEEAGLDPAAYAAALDEQEYAERHRQALTESARMHITVVPTIVIGSRRIEGVATEGVIRRALHEAAAA